MFVLWLRLFHDNKDARFPLHFWFCCTFLNRCFGEQTHGFVNLFQTFVDVILNDVEIKRLIHFNELADDHDRSGQWWCSNITLLFHDKWSHNWNHTKEGSFWTHPVQTIHKWQENTSELGPFSSFVFTLSCSSWYGKCYPPRNYNITPKNWWLEDYITLGIAHFQWFSLVLGSVGFAVRRCISESKCPYLGFQTWAPGRLKHVPLLKFKSYLPKRKRSSSNHQFWGAKMLVLGRVYPPFAAGNAAD